MILCDNDCLRTCDMGKGTKFACSTSKHLFQVTRPPAWTPRSACSSYSLSNPDERHWPHVTQKIDWLISLEKRAVYLYSILIQSRESIYIHNTAAQRLHRIAWSGRSKRHHTHRHIPSATTPNLGHRRLTLTCTPLLTEHQLLISHLIPYSTSPIILAASR